MRLSAKAERIATNPPTSVLLICPNGAVIPEGKAVDAAVDAAAEAAAEDTAEARAKVFSLVFRALDTSKSKGMMPAAGRFRNCCHQVHWCWYLLCGSFSLYQIDRGFIFRHRDKARLPSLLIEQIPSEAPR